MDGALKSKYAPFSSRRSFDIYHFILLESLIAVINIVDVYQETNISRR